LIALQREVGMTGVARTEDLANLHEIGRLKANTPNSTRRRAVRGRACRPK